MSIFRNVTKQTLQFPTDGVDPDGIKVVGPGETVTLDDRQDYLIGVETGPGQFERVDLDAVLGGKTIPQLKAALDEAGISYDARATKAQLLELLGE